MIVRMWDAWAEPAKFADLIAWVCDTALPELDHHPLHVSSEVFSSTDQHVVVISKWRSGPVSLAEPPARLIVRPPRIRDYTQVDR